MTTGTTIVLGFVICLLAVSLLLWKWRPDADLECTSEEDRIRAARQYIDAIAFLPASSPKYIEATRLWEKQVPNVDLRRETFLRASAEKVRKAGAEALAPKNNGEATHG